MIGGRAFLGSGAALTTFCDIIARITTHSKDVALQQKQCYCYQ